VVSPLGILWAGVYTMDQLTLHNLGAQAGLSTPIVTFPVAGLLLRAAPEWRRFGSLLTVGGPLTVLLLVAFIDAVPASELATGGDHLGLWQRALGAEVVAWYAAIGWLVFRGPRHVT
jgi:hypothetical protein